MASGPAPSSALRVLRLTPLFDWRAVEPAIAEPDPRDHLGGHAVQVLRLARATADLGVEQTVLTLRAAGGPRRAALPGGIEVAGVGRAGVPGTHRRNGAWLAAVLADLPRRRGEGYDVVHAHASGLVEPLWAAIAARRILRIPLVLTLHHSAQVNYVPRSRRDAAVQVLTRAAERRAVRDAARTLTLSRRTADRLAGGAVEPMPDCLDVDAFSAAGSPAAAASLRARLEIPPDASVVAYAGRLSPEKGWPAMLRIAQTLPEVHVVLCGDGPDRAQAQRAARGRVHFAGSLAADDVAAVMAAAQVFVLPSVFEELGSVLVEAMAVGTPAVAYDVGGVREVVREGVTGRVVAAADEDALVAAVRSALADPVLAASAREHGPALALERFDQRAAGRRLRDLYAELAG